MVERCGGQLNLKSWENVESGHEVEFGFGDPRRAFGQLPPYALGRPVVSRGVHHDAAGPRVAR